MNLWPWSRIRELEASERAAVQAAADDRRALELERAARKFAEQRMLQAKSEVKRLTAELARLRQAPPARGVSEPARTPPPSILTRHARAKQMRAPAQPARPDADPLDMTYADLAALRPGAPALAGAGGAFGGAGASATWDSNWSDTSSGASDAGPSSSASDSSPSSSND